MPQIELTDKERLFLATQYEILALLKKDDRYELMSNSLISGHKWLYDQFFDHVSENLTDDKAEHVLKILDIYGCMKDSYRELKDKTDIEAQQLEFPGFDGNNESELLCFAGDLIKHGRFESTLGEHAKNSHMPTIDTYSRMIQCWQSLGEPNYPYSKAIIVQLLNARIHPNNR